MYCNAAQGSTTGKVFFQKFGRGFILAEKKNKSLAAVVLVLHLVVDLGGEMRWDLMYRLLLLAGLAAALPQPQEEEVHQLTTDQPTHPQSISILDQIHFHIKGSF
jgi:hypothetical protein